jgi:tRNA G18 (ribose-2'-O)-methylase SpoU
VTLRRRYARLARGYFAVGIYHPKTGANVGSLWRSASLFGASYVFTVGRRYQLQASDTPNTARRIPLHHFSDVGDLVRHLPTGCPLVGVELDERAEPLRRFVHPERGAYLLGAEDAGLPAAVLDRCHFLTRIEYPAPEPMNVACAGSVVLHDRYAKSLAVSAEAAS